MKVLTKEKFDDKKKIELLVCPFWEGQTSIENFPKTAKKDFCGKQGEAFFYYPEKGNQKRILFLGLGKKEKCSLESLRKSFAKVIEIASKKNLLSLDVQLPEKSKFTKKEMFRAALEGLYLMNYDFSFKEKKKQIKEATFYGVDDKGKTATELQKIFSSVYLARDLVNQNADDIFPESLAKKAKELEKLSSKVKVTIFDKKRIEKEKMGLLLAVNRGSHKDPRFIIIEYKGAKSTEKPIVIVGKGVTYDTGGLSLKPTSNMLSMKCDMGGGACAIGTMHAVISLGLKINVTVVVPATENGIDALSYKPGDVYIGYNKKSVEITNTDAEGRLILADALAYAEKNLKPKCIIDLATLTGGVIVALGDDVIGMFSKDKTIKSKLQKSSDITGELVWELPLHDPYLEMMKSPIADLKNSAGREASSITAALFLQEFVGSIPWVHLDIAGPAFYEKAKGYYPTQATGVGVRLLVEFLKSY